MGFEELWVWRLWELCAGGWGEVLAEGGREFWAEDCPETEIRDRK